MFLVCPGVPAAARPWGPGVPAPARPRGPRRPLPAMAAALVVAVVAPAVLAVSSSSDSSSIFSVVIFGGFPVVVCDGSTASREAITLSSREASLSPIRLPIDDTGQFIDSPTVPVIAFDFESHSL